MKKALLVAGCGMILALIVGAASHVKGSASQRKVLDINRCSESLTNTHHDSPCQWINKRGSLSDKFLRAHKQRVKRAYV